MNNLASHITMGKIKALSWMNKKTLSCAQEARFSAMETVALASESVTKEEAYHVAEDSKEEKIVVEKQISSG